MSRIAIFIDGAYLTRQTQELGTPKIDLGALALKLADGREILRTFYYDCLPFVGNPPSADERERFSRRDRFFTALSHLPRFEVRLGQLECRGESEAGKPIFEQKRVDVSAAVDLVVLAAKRLITDAVILAGDSDFIPAVYAAKAEGVVVHLCHGRQVHADLIRACDERVRMTRDLFDSFTLGTSAPFMTA